MKNILQIIQFIFIDFLKIYYKFVNLFLNYKSLTAQQQQQQQSHSLDRFCNTCLGSKMIFIVLVNDEMKQKVQYRRPNKT